MRSPRVATTHSNDEKELSSIKKKTINQNIIKQMKTINSKHKNNNENCIYPSIFSPNF
jgi:hypothetical protein